MQVERGGNLVDDQMGRMEDRINFNVQLLAELMP